MNKKTGLYIFLHKKNLLNYQEAFNIMEHFQ